MDFFWEGVTKKFFNAKRAKKEQRNAKEAVVLRCLCLLCVRLLSKQKGQVNLTWPLYI